MLWLYLQAADVAQRSNMSSSSYCHLSYKADLTGSNVQWKTAENVSCPKYGSI